MRRWAVVAVDAERAAVGVGSPDTVRWVEKRTYDGKAGPAEVVDVLLAHKDIRSLRRVRIMLHPSLLQLRTLGDLPPVKQRELAELVRGQARKFFRVGDNPLNIDAVWANDTAGERRARAAAVDAALVDRLEEAVTRTGMVVVGVGVADEPGGERLDLRTRASQARHATRLARVSLVYAFVAVGAWAVAAGVYAGDLYMDVHNMRTELDGLREPLRQIAQIRTQIEDFEPLADAATRQGPSRAWATPLLARLSEALPPDAHVRHLTMYRDSLVRLEGQAEDPVAVVHALDSLSVGTPRLEGTGGPAGPPGEGGTHFTLVLEGLR